MTQLKLIFDYIAMLLAKQPLDFDIKKSMYIKLLNDLKSLEKNHVQIMAIQKCMIENEMAEKYLGSDTRKTEKPLISQQIKSMMKLELQTKEATIESKNKLLNVLSVIELNQKLLQRKSKEEIEQIQTKLAEVQKSLHLSSNVFSQLHTKNIKNKKKTDELIKHMKSVENEFENLIDGFKLNVKELNKSITEISKEIVTGLPLDNKENGYIIRKKYNSLMNSESNLLNSHIEYAKTIKNYINKMDELQPTKKLPQNETLHNIDWTDFLMTFNLENENLFLDIHQKYHSVTAVNTLLAKLNDAEQTLNSSIKDSTLMINDVQNKRNATITVLKKLNEDLDTLKQNKNSIMISHRKNNDLNDQYTDNISDLEHKIHQSNTRLTAAIQNNENLHHDLQRSDIFFKTFSQNYINQLNSAYQLLLLNDKKLSEGIFLFENLRTLKQAFDELLREQTKIILFAFNAKKSTMETLKQKKSKNVVEICNTITSYKNKQNICKQLIIQLNDLNTYTENYNNDLINIYHQFVFNNHGKTLKQLKEEEIEYQRNIDLCVKELDKLNEESRIIENNSNLMNIKEQIKNYNEKLLQISSANESLKVGLNKNNIH